MGLYFLRPQLPTAGYVMKITIAKSNIDTGILTIILLYLHSFWQESMKQRQKSGTVIYVASIAPGYCWRLESLYQTACCDSHKARCPWERLPSGNSNRDLVCTYSLRSGYCARILLVLEPLSESLLRRSLSETPLATSSVIKLHRDKFLVCTYSLGASTAQNIGD